MPCDHGAMRPRHANCPDCGEPRPVKYILAKDNGKTRVFWDDSIPGWTHDSDKATRFDAEPNLIGSAFTIPV